jgi:2-(1,2-epoxy-1,2-dihydrophenyl)acetyl-CoA isomerase
VTTQGATDAVVVERDGPVGIISLNRPDAANAIDEAVATGLRDASAELAGDESIATIVLCGNGARFSVGGDIVAFRASGAELPTDIMRLAGIVHEAIVTLAEGDVVSVAAVQGAVAGIAVSLVAACDLVVAEQSAFFTAAYTKIGLTPDGGMTYALPRSVGERRARELVLTNRRLTAPDALEWGLVNEVVDDGTARERAIALARECAGTPRQVIGAVKQLFAQGRSASFREQLDAEVESIGRSAADAALGL